MGPRERFDRESKTNTAAGTGRTKSEPRNTADSTKHHQYDRARIATRLPGLWPRRDSDGSGTKRRMAVWMESVQLLRHDHSSISAEQPTDAPATVSHLSGADSFKHRCAVPDRLRAYDARIRQCGLRIH